jgi:pimeloyl-ACP methyl ester carboxylesterase
MRCRPSSCPRPWPPCWRPIRATTPWRSSIRPSTETRPAPASWRRSPAAPIAWPTPLVEAVRHGLAGVAADIEAQARPLEVDLVRVACQTRLWYGSADAVTPPAFGEWYARELPAATLDLLPGAAHYLLFTRWADILATLAATHGS